MDCKKFEHDLSAYYDQLLQQDELKQFLEHKEACPECKELFKDYKMTMKVVNDVKPIDLPPKFQEKLRAKLQEESALLQKASDDMKILDIKNQSQETIQKPARQRPWLTVMKVSAALAACVLIVFGAFVGIGTLFDERILTMEAPEHMDAASLDMEVETTSEETVLQNDVDIGIQRANDEEDVDSKEQDLLFIESVYEMQVHKINILSTEPEKTRDRLIDLLEPFDIVMTNETQFASMEEDHLVFDILKENVTDFKKLLRALHPEGWMQGYVIHETERIIYEYEVEQLQKEKQQLESRLASLHEDNADEKSRQKEAMQSELDSLERRMDEIRQLVKYSRINIEIRKAD